MNAYIIPTLVISIVFNLFLTVIIASKGFKKLVNFLFLLLAASVSAWILALLGYFSGLNLNFNWVVGTHVSAITIAILFYFLSSVFPRPIYKSRLVYILPAILYGVIFYFLFFTTDIIGKTNGLTYEINNGYLFYQFSLILFFFAGYYNLYKELQVNKDITERIQIKYILAGSISSSALAMITDMLLPFINIYNLTWLGPIFTLALVASISISIARYKLFNIKVVATEAFVFLLWAFLLIRAIVSNNTADQITNFVLFFITVFVGLLLIRSVMKEVYQREKIEKLAVDLERSNTELEVANERLKELDKQKTEFVSIASHQLRSPLTAIKGYSSMLLEGSFGKLSEKPKGAVQVIFESSQKLVGVIEDFLNITRIELGKMKYDMSIIDMGKMVESVVNELKPNVMRRGLTMTFTGSDGPYNIYADSGKLNQVFLNVIDNAIKYTEKGSIAVDISRREEGSKTLIRFTSTDTGVGMDEKTLPKLFEKFVRASDAGNINITGTGLGLFVAKQIVEAHGGKIWAESEGKGKGSKFIVEIEENKTIPTTSTTSNTPAPEIQVEQKAVSDLAKAI